MNLLIVVVGGVVTGEWYCVDIRNDDDDDDDHDDNTSTSVVTLLYFKSLWKLGRFEFIFFCFKINKKWSRTKPNLSPIVN